MRWWVSFVALMTSCCDTGEQVDVDAQEAGDHADADAEASAACTDAEVAAAEEELRALASRASGCFAGWIVVDDAHVMEVTFHASYNSFGWWLSSCNVHPHTTWGNAIRMELAVWEAIGPWRAPCPHLMVFVVGGAQTDVTTMGEEIGRTCDVPWDAYFVIEIDEDGRVSDVYGDRRATELVACIQGVLSDDLFPCLATTQLCPSYVISGP